MFISSMSAAFLFVFAWKCCQPKAILRHSGKGSLAFIVQTRAVFYVFAFTDFNA